MSSLRRFGNNEVAEENEATETDIFQQQKKTIDTLINVLERQGAVPAQPVYVTQTQPAKPTNYLLYIGMAALAFLFFKGKK